LRVGGRAARRSCLSNLRRGGGGRQAGETVLSCLVWRCELSRPDRLSKAFCVGPTQFTPLHRHDKTVLSVSCRVYWCELYDCSERVHTSNFSVGDSLQLSCESNSHRRSGRDADKTVLSCLAWRCELASRRSRSNPAVYIAAAVAINTTVRCQIQT